ncbi:MAG: ABC transporter ATP-binding protein [Alphaproteobacteria bacterium]
MSESDFEDFDDQDEEREAQISFLEVFLFCWGYWRRFPLSMPLLAAGMLAVTATSVVQPWLAGQLIDAIATKGGGEGDTAHWMLAGFLVTIFANVVLRYAHDQVWMRVACTSMMRLGSDAFHRVQRFSTDWHNNSFAGATVRKITRGIWSFDEFGDTLNYGFIPTALMVLGTMIILSSQWMIMGVLIGSVTVVYLVLVYFVSKNYVAPANRAFAAQDSKLSGSFADAITCNATVKAFAAEDREERTLGAVIGDWRRKVLRTWHRGTNAYLMQSMVLLALQAALLGLSLYYWTVGQATPGQVTLVLTTNIVLNGYLRDFGMHIRNMQKSINDMEDVIRFQEQDFGVEDRPDATDLRIGHGQITFDRVGFQYPNQAKPVYEGFDLNIAPGEKIALVGKSGSGKSTFVKLVQRLYDVTDGRILIDGQDIRHVTQHSLRQGIALVPQEPALFHRSLAENIAYGKPDASRAQIEWAATKAHAHTFVAGLPDGYGTLVGERGVKLSGGERQRVAIARAFLADAPILILDEATSSLDSVTEEHIQAAMSDLMQGRTTILIAHRLSTIQMVDRILVFSDGRVVEQGTHTELLARVGGHYRELYETQYGPTALSA